MAARPCLETRPLAGECVGDQTLSCVEPRLKTFSLPTPSRWANVLQMNLLVK